MASMTEETSAAATKVDAQAIAEPFRKEVHNTYVASWSSSTDAGKAASMLGESLSAFEGKSTANLPPPAHPPGLFLSVIHLLSCVFGIRSLLRRGYTYSPAALVCPSNNAWGLTGALHPYGVAYRSSCVLVRVLPLLVLVFCFCRCCCCCWCYCCYRGLARLLVFATRGAGHQD